MQEGSRGSYLVAQRKASFLSLYHKLGGLNNINVLSHISGSCKSEIKVLIRVGFF